MRPLIRCVGVTALLGAVFAGCRDDSLGPRPFGEGATVAEGLPRLSASAATASGTTWDATAQFSTTTNPKGAFSSGWTATLGGTLMLFPKFENTGSHHVWHDPAATNVIGTPAFFMNVSSGTINGVLSGSAALHSGCRAGEYAVVRWTAPTSGGYSVLAQFFAGDQSNTDAHVLRNGGAASPLYSTSSTSSSPSFTTTLSLAAGETLDFAVGPGGDGCFYDSTPVTIRITQESVAKPVVANAGGPYSGNEGQAIAFSSAGSSDANGGTLTYAWSFGDGTSSTAANPSKNYRDNGIYNVRLIVMNAAGQADTAATTATIANVAPTGKFTVAATPVTSTMSGAAGAEGEEVGAEGEEAGSGEDAATTTTTPSKKVPEGTAYTLKLSGTDAGTKDRSTLQYALDCGQGAGFTPWSKINTLSCPAIPNQKPAFPIQAKVKDKDGAETLYVINLAITNANPVVTLISTSPTTIAENGTLSVRGSFTDSGVNDNPWSYSINWGDGTATSIGTASAQGGAIPLSHSFTQAGIFKVRLTVKDKDGGVGASVPIIVTVSAVADGLVARYSFDSCDARDDSGKGGPGTVYGGPQCVLGVRGKALRFDGTDDYVNAPVSSNRHPVTISVVFSAARIDGERSIVDSDASGRSGHSIIMGYGDGDGSLDVQYHDGMYDSPFPVTANRWYHAVAVIEATTVTLYVNGKLIGSKAYTASLPLDGTEFRIGRHNAQDPQWFQGLVDDVRIFDRALTRENVEQLFLEVGVPTP